MRFAERFLVVFALISILMRVCGMKDGPTMELLALPLLALFYLIALPFLLKAFERNAQENLQPGRIVAALLTGAGMAYCLISLLLYTLGWQVQKADMLENCSLILGLSIAASVAGRLRGGGAFYMKMIPRPAILLVVVLSISAVPVPAIGSLSRGAF